MKAGVRTEKITIPTYKIGAPEKSRKFTANVDKDGLGFCSFRLPRFAEESFFHGGHLQGSENWQSFLTDKAGDYVEIQAGLGKTQYECITMASKTSISFSECYALASISPESVTATYTDALNAIKAQINSFYSEEAFEELCEKTSATFRLCPER